MWARTPSPYPAINLNSKPLELSSKTPSFIPKFSSSIHPGAKSAKLGRTGPLRSGFCVRSSYTRTPLEAPGAYQLIDEETGQKVIVWGGADDPPPDLGDINKLKLKNDSGLATGTNSGKGRGDGKDGVEWVETVSNKDSPTASIGTLSGGFGRLKTQKIKALVNKAYQLKQEANEAKYESEEESVVDKPGSSDSKLGYIGKMKKITNFNSTGEEMDHSDADLNYDVEHEVYPYSSNRSKTKQAGSEASSGSSSNLRGWGGGRSTQRFKSEPKDLSKQRKKFSIDGDFFSRKSFKDLGCSESMMEVLEAQLYIRPSHIQAMSFSSILEGKSCVIADQSGSGKTLAYLAPLVQRLRQEEIQGVSKSSSQSPRAVILVPTAELASQVLSNCRSMSKSGAPFRSMAVTGGFRQKTQLENLEEGIDVLIATPGRFMYLIKEGFLQLTSLRCAALDEVDILFNDEDFEVALQNLISSSPVTTQYLFVTATLPVDIYNKLVEVFPDCKVIMGPGMHRTSPGLEEVLVDCSGEDEAERTPETAFSNKRTALLQLVENIPVPKTIIFCNKIETCRKVENVLKRYDRKGKRARVLPFHAALEQKSRLASMKEFTNSHTESNRSLFLVCTDRASRGIDFSGVDHVVLFDFPRDPSEYVRRVGRTARGAGGKGKAFIFVVGKQVSLAQRIIERNQKGHPLHDVPAAYELF